MRFPDTKSRGLASRRGSTCPPSFRRIDSTLPSCHVTKRNGGSVTIVSFRPAFIFIKTRKVASTSIEVHLAERCGPDAVVTPIFPAHPAHEPRNFTGYRNHMEARQIRSRNPFLFAAAFKFAFERHPVEKTLSYFAWMLHSPEWQPFKPPRTWREYLERGAFPVDAHLYTDDAGKLIIDKIYRYEEMNASLRDISAKTGLLYAPLVTREKIGFRRDDVPQFEDVMADSSTRNRIMDAFAPSLRFTNY
jgi:hypothetical protein